LKEGFGRMLSSQLLQLTFTHFCLDILSQAINIEGDEEKEVKVNSKASCMLDPQERNKKRAIRIMQEFQ
jgi:hypothetical protein